MPLFKCKSSRATPRKGIAYITRPDKAKYVDTRNLFEDEDYAKQFMQTAAMYGKGTDSKERKYYHIKLSCDKKDNVSAELHHDYALRMARELFPDEQCVIATHTDSDVVHSHIIVNAVNPITGKKLHFTDDEYAAMKDKANEVGKEYGFRELDWRKKAKNKRTSEERHIRLKGGTSWKEELREVIEEGIRESKTPDEFKAYLDECYGVKITRDGKDYSYLHPQKNKPIRGANLGTNYTKTEVLRRIGEQKNRQKSAADSGWSGLNGQQTGAGALFGGGRSTQGGAGRFISESVSGIQRAMQQLDKAAEYAAVGLDAASEERRREQQRVSAELERKKRESDEKARRGNKNTGDSEDGNGSGSSNSFGKGD